MKTLINACKQIVAVAIEIRNTPGIDIVKADSVYLRLFAVKEMLEKYRPQQEPQPTHNPWCRIDDTEWLVEGTRLLVYGDGKKAFGVFCNGKIATLYHEATHYMVIPECEVE